MTTKNETEIGLNGVRQAIENVFTSSDPDANIVDALEKLSGNAYRVANAIADQRAAPGRDVHGGHIGCLLEAVMGVTKSLQNIADAMEPLGGIAGAIEKLADAVESHGKTNRPDRELANEGGMR